MRNKSQPLSPFCPFPMWIESSHFIPSRWNVLPLSIYQHVCISHPVRFRHQYWHNYVWASTASLLANHLYVGVLPQTSFLHWNSAKVLSKLGRSNSTLLTGNQSSPPQSSQTRVYCFTVAGSFGVLLLVSSHSLSYLFCFLKDLIPDLELSLLLRLACPGGGQATSGDMLGEAMTVSGKSGTVKRCFGPKQTQVCSTTQSLCFSALAEPTLK